MLQIYADTFKIATRMDTVVSLAVPTLSLTAKTRVFRLRQRLGKLVRWVRKPEAGL